MGNTYDTTNESLKDLSVPRDLTKPLDEDLYCLTCGYNLRGLFGDPVRCPECGENNDLGTAAIPAHFISNAMRRMETAPTICTACALIIEISGGLIFYTSIRDAICPTSSALLFLVLWFVFYYRMQEVYEGKSGWQRILWDFHLTVFLCTIAVPLYWLAAQWGTALFGNALDNFWLAPIILTIPSCFLGVSIYRKAQQRIATMQRETAIRIAKETLRRELHKQKDR